eukprot:scaffold207809_cov32-Tisochrysis_lutea.AAC.11
MFAGLISKQLLGAFKGESAVDENLAVGQRHARDLVMCNGRRKSGRDFHRLAAHIYDAVIKFHVVLSALNLLCVHTWESEYGRSSISHNGRPAKSM